MEKAKTVKATAAPPQRRTSVLTTRANQYPRKALPQDPPKFTGTRKSVPVIRDVAKRQAVTIATPATERVNSSPFAASSRTPRSPVAAAVSPFARNARTPRTPPMAFRTPAAEEEQIEWDIKLPEEKQEQQQSNDDDMQRGQPEAEETRGTNDYPPTSNTEEESPHMVTTTYTQPASALHDQTAVVTQIKNLNTKLETLQEKLFIFENRVTGYEEAQEEYAKALHTVQDNQNTLCGRLEQLSANQDKLTESQAQLSRSQEAGFDKLVSLMGALKTTMEQQQQNHAEEIQKYQAIKKEDIETEKAEEVQTEVEQYEEKTITTEVIDVKQEMVTKNSETSLPMKNEANDELNMLPIKSGITPATPTTTGPYSAQFKADKPEKFTGRVANNALEKWIYAVQNYAKATRLSEQDTLYFAISSLKDQAADWWLATTINMQEQGDEITTFEQMKTLMRKHFADHTTKAQAVSNLRTLQEKKSVTGYTQEFLRLRMLCPELPEKVAKDYFVEGLQADIRPHVALAKPATVDEAVEAAILAATAIRAKPAQKPFENRTKNWNDNSKRENNNFVKDNRAKNKFENKKPFKKDPKKIICNFCRKPGHIEANCRRKTANKENKTAEDNNNKKKPIRKNNVELESPSEDELHESEFSSDMDCDVLKVNCVAYDTKRTGQIASAAYDRLRNDGHELITVLAHINGRKARILIDSGAGGNFISEEFAKIFRIRKNKMMKPVKIQYADKRRVQCEHEVKSAKITIGKYEKIIPLIVAPLAYDAILGKPWLTMENPDIDWQANKVWVTKENTRIALPRNQTAMGNIIFPISYIRMQHEAQQEGTRLFAISIHDTEEKKVDPTATSTEPEMARKIMNDYPNVFTEEHPGGLPEQRQVKHKIELVDNDNPPCRQMHLMSQSELVELRQQLDTYLEKGWIRPSDSPFGAPVLFALKKDGSKRLCIDYRALNKITKKSRYPLPRFEELQAMIGRANWFSKIDLANGYHQVPISEEDCFKTAFRTRFGQFEWTVMPFGLTNAPATFQRLINNVLRPLQNKCAAGTLDDILIFTTGSKEEHDRDIRLVVELLAKNKLYAKPKKCSFFQQEVEYWGHVVTKDGWTTEKNKIEAIKNWPSPLPNVHAVRSFIGICAYYRRYVKSFAEIALPLHELIRKEGEYIWTKQCDEAMQILKEKLTTAPILMVADCTKPFVVTTDASQFAIGAVLQQYDDKGELRPIAFESKKLKVNRVSKKQDMGEIRYPTHEKEMLAIIHAAKVWRHLLLGSKVTFLTDHMPLKHLQGQHQLSDRQIRWMQLLQQYDFEIKYKPGVENVVADALSRRCDLANIVGIQAEDSFMQDIRKEYTKDKETKETMELCKSNPNVYKQGHRVFVKDEALWINKNGRILTWVPATKVKDVLKTIHEEHGHPGKSKFSELVHRNYWWPRMTSDINKCVKECKTCQETKTPNTKPQGLLQPLPAAKGPWQRIAMDLVTDLPLTNQGNDAILTITDTFTKYIHIIPTQKTSTSTQLAELVFNHIIRLHGVPLVILSDRDPRFLSDMWKHIWTKMGTRLAMSTAFHPQTDGQSERTNRSVLAALRTRVNDHKDEWDVALPIIQLTLNNLVNETTGFSPFFANFNFHPRIPPCTGSAHQHENLGPFLNKRIDNTNVIRENITKAQQKQKIQADKKRKEVKFKEGDYVLLSTKNLRFRGTSRKLAPKYIGPLKIIKVVNEVTYELVLPEGMKIYNKFHANLLKSFQGNVPEKIHIHPGFMSTAPIEEYEVEDILQDRIDEVDGKNIRFFLVKWKNSDVLHATWEPQGHLANARGILREYMHRKQQKQT